MAMPGATPFTRGCDARGVTMGWRVAAGGARGHSPMPGYWREMDESYGRGAPSAGV